MATQKQDRQAARTVSEIERNYGKRFSTLLGLIEDSRDHVDSVESGLKDDILQTSTKLARTSEMIEAEAKKVTTLGEEVSQLKITAKGVDMVSEDSNGKLATLIGNGDNGGEWFAKYYKTGSTDVSSGLYFDFSEDEFVFTGQIKGGSININDRFMVDKYGNVTLPYGTSISWGDMEDIPDDLATKDDIPDDDHITEITENTIRTTYVVAENLCVNAANVKGTLTIGALPDEVATKDNVTEITNTTLKTTNVVAENLVVKAANIDGALTFGDGSYYIDPGATSNYLNLPGLEITSSGATFDGDIEARSGHIGGFTLQYDMLVFPHGAGYIDPEAGQGSYIYLPNFRVGDDGVVAEGKIIITSGGRIGPFYVDEYQLHSGTNSGKKIWLGPYGLAIDYSSEDDCLFFASVDNDMVYVRNLYIQGTWSSGNDLSDARVKNTIEKLPEQYEALFNGLIPSRYKYNNGTSGRFHTGFIAQEVVSAIENAGLTTQDFAGVMLMDQGTDDEHWYLRRDEFVSLNTWQIQKLKARVAELEKKLEAQYAVN